MNASLRCRALVAVDVDCITLRAGMGALGLWVAESTETSVRDRDKDAWTGGSPSRSSVPPQRNTIKETRAPGATGASQGEAGQSLAGLVNHRRQRGKEALKADDSENRRIFEQDAGTSSKSREDTVASTR